MSANRIIQDKVVSISTSSNSPCAISICASVGFGKTHFLKNVKNDLDKKYPVINFNASSYDYMDEPLMALLVCIKRELSRLSTTYNINSKLEIIASKAWRFMRGAAPIAAKAAITRLAGSETLSELSGLLGSQDRKDELIDFFGESSKQLFKIYDESIDTVAEIRDCLSEIIKSAINETELRAPLIIIVDELDQCTPDFSVNLLRKIKHLFNVENIVFIVALDIKSLGDSISFYHGNNFDGMTYLSNIFDYSFYLPRPNYIDLSNNCFSKDFFECGEYCLNKHGLEIFSVDYNFVDLHNGSHCAYVLSIFSHICKHYKVSIDTLISSQKKLCKILKLNNDVYVDIFFITFLTILSFHRYECVIDLYNHGGIENEIHNNDSIISWRKNNKLIKEKTNEIFEFYVKISLMDYDSLCVFRNKCSEKYQKIVCESADKAKKANLPFIEYYQLVLT